MSHTIEVAKTGRASCRTCKKPIAKDTLRFGEEVPNAFAAGEMTYQWHHLECAAKKKPGPLKIALDATTLEIPNRAELEKAMAEGAKKEKPTTFPYAERAPTGRSTCMVCSEAIAKGELRVAVEREVDTGSFVTKGAGYLHPACSLEHVGEDIETFFGKLKASSGNLDAADLDTLKAELEA
jgi:poly [ADP-ribose] polymerase